MKTVGFAQKELIGFDTLVNPVTHDPFTLTEIPLSRVSYKSLKKFF